MSGVTRMISGEVAQSGTKGAAYLKEIQDKLSPESIANCDADGDYDNDKGRTKEAGDFY